MEILKKVKLFRLKYSLYLPVHQVVMISHLENPSVPPRVRSEATRGVIGYQGWTGTSGGAMSHLGESAECFIHQYMGRKRLAAPALMGGSEVVYTQPGPGSFLGHGDDKLVPGSYLIGPGI